MPKEIDYIISHDAPGCVNQQWKPRGAPARLLPTKNQEVLQQLYKKVDFKT